MRTDRRVFPEDRPRSAWSRCEARAGSVYRGETSRSVRNAARQTTSTESVSGVRSFASFERTQQLFIEWSIEIVGDDEASLVDTEHGALPFNRYEACYRSSRTGDDDVLSRNGLPQQPGEMGFRFVNTDLMHDDKALD